MPLPQYLAQALTGQASKQNHQTTVLAPLMKKQLRQELSPCHLARSAEIAPSQPRRPR
jgi:hypothetical protein